MANLFGPASTTDEVLSTVTLMLTWTIRILNGPLTNRLWLMGGRKPRISNLRSPLTSGTGSVACGRQLSIQG